MAEEKQFAGGLPDEPLNEEDNGESMLDRAQPFDADNYEVLDGLYRTDGERIWVPEECVRERVQGARREALEDAAEVLVRDADDITKPSMEWVGDVLLEIADEIRALRGEGA